MENEERPGAVPGDVDGDGLPDVPAVGGDATVDDPVMAFWHAALAHVGWGRLDVVMGEPARDAVMPQAWSFGDNPELSDELLGLVLAGTKTATASLVSEYEAEGVATPVPGDLSIVLDGAGLPGAVIRTTAVSIVPFDEVDAEHAAAEGEGDTSLAQWRQVHEEVWRRAHGADFDVHAAQVVAEQFELVYPRRSS